jgi:hypothetical protein
MDSPITGLRSAHDAPINALKGSDNPCVFIISLCSQPQSPQLTLILDTLCGPATVALQSPLEVEAGMASTIKVMGCKWSPESNWTFAPGSCGLNCPPSFRQNEARIMVNGGVDPKPPDASKCLEEI